MDTPTDNATAQDASTPVEPPSDPPWRRGKLVGLLPGDYTPEELDDLLETLLDEIEQAEREDA